MSKRAGVTKKVTVSVHQDDLAVLKRRAKRLYGGNVSAVFAEFIASIKRKGVWAKAVAWYGQPLTLTDDEREATDRELVGSAPRRRRPTAGTRAVTTGAGERAARGSRRR